ncbi:hypothetical protein ECANGB1_1440 [Enterospora canceri]|uniref:Cyclin N-terminal domain-containing protein n=1 Tax=Enterospora canceri TaxID=1081671 RepID=A0A1Y1S628_9MICR|nr:hypothetical protein ECANGB1_1440 [Enterospora canceri]
MISNYIGCNEMYHASNTNSDEIEVHKANLLSRFLDLKISDVVHKNELMHKYMTFSFMQLVMAVNCTMQFQNYIFETEDEFVNVFSGCVALSTKYLTDNCVSNEVLSEVLDYDIDDMNYIEKMTLGLLEYDLCATDQELQGVIDRFVDFS